MLMPPLHAGGTEGDAPALGARRDEARGSPRTVPRADQESGPPFLPDDAAGKGHVTRRKVGKAYYYKPATRPRSAFRSMLGELVDAYCGGSIQTLVLNIIKSEKLSEDDLIELKRLADQGPDAQAAG